MGSKANPSLERGLTTLPFGGVLSLSVLQLGFLFDFV